jgi:hypothetical protein
MDNFILAQLEKDLKIVLEKDKRVMKITKK